MVFSLSSSQIKDILEKNYYPLLKSEEELTQLMNELTNLQIEFDPEEVRALTGLYQMFPNSVDYDAGYEAGKELIPVRPQAVIRQFGKISEAEYRGSEFNFVYEIPDKISFYTNYPSLRKKVEKKFRSFGIELHTSYQNVRTQYLLARLMAPYLPEANPVSEFDSSKLKTLYFFNSEIFSSPSEIHTKVEKVRGQAILTKISCKSVVEMEAEFYDHPILKKFSFSLRDGFSSMSLHFYREKDGQEWLKENGLQTDDFCLSKRKILQGSEIKKFWRLLKEKNLLTIPQDSLPEMKLLDREVGQLSEDVPVRRLLDCGIASSNVGPVSTLTSYFHGGNSLQRSIETISFSGKL